MSGNEDCLSDSDQSDEDFCPENEKVTDSEENYEESDEISNSEDDSSDTKQDKLNKKTKISKNVGHKIKKKKNKLNRKKLTTKIAVNNENDNAVSSGNDFEKHNLATDDKDEKQKTDALWASFLSDVSQTTSTITKLKTITDNNDNSSEKLSITKENDQNSLESKTSSSSITLPEKSEKIKITQIVDFAGEEIQIEKEISADELQKLSKSKTANSSVKIDHQQTVTNSNDSNTVKTSLPPSSSIKNTPKLINPLKRPLSGCSSSSSGGGLGSILNKFGKKTKISVLEKSKMDWDNFKQKEGLKEELQTFNKGKDGYLERQDFLQRTDLRQFEIESSLRKSKRCNKNNI